MAYSLSQAVQELKRSIIWVQERVEQAELLGYNDGVNRVFRTPSAPVENLTLTNRDGTPYNGSWTLYPSSGTIVFATAPAVGAVPLASYDVVEYTDAELLDITRSGFDEMERRVPRNLHLVESGGETYISSRPDAVEDPVFDGIPFSQSRSQIALFLLCCLLRLVRAMRLRASSASFLYRESAPGGTTVDKRTWYQSFASMEEGLSRDIQDAVDTIATRAGDYIPGARSDDYLANFEWWSRSRQARGAVP